jgi:hypothetical protein
MNASPGSGEPGPRPDRFFYADAQNHPVGPHSREDLKKLLAVGVIAPGSWVIAEGGAAWEPLDRILAEMPPPPALSAARAKPEPHPQICGLQAEEDACGDALDAPDAGRPCGISGLWAFVLFLIFPFGYLAWGQFHKGLVWLVLAAVTAGIGWVIMAVDYWMCWHAQRFRRLDPWEWFPPAKLTE